MGFYPNELVKILRKNYEILMSSGCNRFFLRSVNTSIQSRFRSVNVDITKPAPYQYLPSNVPHLSTAVDHCSDHVGFDNSCEVVITDVSSPDCNW